MLSELVLSLREMCLAAHRFGGSGNCLSRSSEAILGVYGNTDDEIEAFRGETADDADTLISGVCEAPTGSVLGLALDAALLGALTASVVGSIVAPVAAASAAATASAGLAAASAAAAAAPAAATPLQAFAGVAVVLGWPTTRLFAKLRKRLSFPGMFRVEAFFTIGSVAWSCFGAWALCQPGAPLIGALYWLSLVSVSLNFAMLLAMLLVIVSNHLFSLCVQCK